MTGSRYLLRNLTNFASGCQVLIKTETGSGAREKEREIVILILLSQILDQDNTVGNQGASYYPFFGKNIFNKNLLADCGL